jgi:hypothetical protein
VRRVILVLFGVSCISCSGKRDAPKADAPERPPSLENADFSEITPMLDGSAYAVSSDSRLRYLRGNKGVLVTVAGNASAKLPEFFDITPVLDGGAYATSIELDSGVWYLHGEHAEKVEEVQTLPDSVDRPRISKDAFKALYFSERKKREEAEDFVENPPEEEGFDDYQDF